MEGTIEDRMKAPFFDRDWVDVSSMTRSELEFVLSKAKMFKEAVKEKRVPDYKLAKGMDLFAALLFYEPSTRTRTSFEVAAKRLGMETTGFAGTEATSVSKGESLIDTVDMYDSYDMDAVVMRHPLDGAARAVADHIMMSSGRPMPCFNGGDGKNEHPTQAILDVFTINECCGRLHELDIGIAVDAKYGRTTHSLPVIMSLFPGNRFHIFTHELLRMPKSVLKYLEAKGVEYHEYFESGEQLREMLPALDFLYMTRPQKERFTDIADYYKAREMFLFTPDMMEGTKESFGLGHPLPDNKEFPSIHPLVHRHPKYWAKRQAGNGVPTRMTELALSLGLTGWEFDGELFKQADISDAFYAERNPSASERRELAQIRPIENGTVLEHVENKPYAINKIAELLEMENNHNIFRLGVVRSIKRPDVVKGVLMIENRYLTDEELRSIAAISPGATVNDIRNKEVTRKRDLLPPPVLDNLPYMNCTNKGCITFPQHSEHVAPKAVRVADSGSLYKCYCCNHLMEGYEMF